MTVADGDDPWQTERRSSDWLVGDTVPDGSDAAQLALLPVENPELRCRRPDPIVACLGMDSAIADPSWHQAAVGNA
jgi:hypothetical protein